MNKYSYCFNFETEIQYILSDILSHLESKVVNIFLKLDELKNTDIKNISYLILYYQIKYVIYGIFYFGEDIFELWNFDSEFQVESSDFKYLKFTTFYLFSDFKYNGREQKNDNLTKVEFKTSTNSKTTDIKKKNNLSTQKSTTNNKDGIDDIYDGV
jgi:hypothetical protein